MTYQFMWKNTPERRALFGKSCKVVGKARFGFAYVEFENGHREVVPRRSLRLIKESKNGPKTDETTVA